MAIPYALSKVPASPVWGKLPSESALIQVFKDYFAGSIMQVVAVFKVGATATSLKHVPVTTRANHQLCWNCRRIEFD